MPKVENPRYFHFTLGPVQGFVAQARRTRDFWAGSFLLSYLAGIAMLEVKKQHGEIVFPIPDNNYLDWIETGTRTQGKPKHGGIPNRFLAEVPEKFSGKQVKQALKTAWRELAERVWKMDLEGHAAPETRAIWDRQINGFWDVAWVLTPDEEATDLLDRRKNWRSHYLQPEPGMKCMAMEGMQELSGADRPGEGGKFWEDLRGSRKTAIETDLREDERLCAVAYVKRRFVHCFEGFRAEMPSGCQAHGWQAHGWKIPTAVPSVTYIAAAPWLVQAMARANASALWDFHDAAADLAGHGEWDSNLACVRDADGHRQWKALDGHAFFEADLRNAKLFSDRPSAERVLGALAGLRQSANPKLGPPAPYYALLLMDGDSLGQHMGEPGKRELISAALNAFTGGVQKIVEQERSGFLIYAGGDDVLALLTLEDALPCAAALRTCYEAAFGQAFAGQPANLRFPATISAAIQYAHYRLPFTKILADAHGLLDEVAKDGRGRDAVAARVWKQSGLHLTYAQPWAIALQEGGIADLVGRLRGEGGEKTQVAGGFFYRMRELFALLKPAKEGGEKFDPEDMVKLLAYEYRHSGIHDAKIGQEKAVAFIRPLLAQCRPAKRKVEQAADNGPVITFEEQPKLEADAALLVRFLASGGGERH